MRVNSSKVQLWRDDQFKCPYIYLCTILLVMYQRDQSPPPITMAPSIYIYSALVYILTIHRLNILTHCNAIYFMQLPLSRHYSFIPIFEKPTMSPKVPRRCSMMYCVRQCLLLLLQKSFLALPPVRSVALSNEPGTR